MYVFILNIDLIFKKKIVEHIKLSIVLYIFLFKAFIRSGGKCYYYQPVNRVDSFPSKMYHVFDIIV
jgi:hypothetical protein